MQQICTDIATVFAFTLKSNVTGISVPCLANLTAGLSPYLKENFDHGMLINRHDPLYKTLLDHCERTGENFRLKVLDGPTSVENLAWVMFTEITDMGFRLDRIEIQETDTSTIIYTRDDWVKDNRHFAAARDLSET